MGDDKSSNLPAVIENDSNKSAKPKHIEPKLWGFVMFAISLIHNIGELLLALYGLTKKILRFWWVALLVFFFITLFSPNTGLTEVFKDILKLIEDIKKI